MPMFKALKLCPEAVVIRPRMEHYVEVSRAIRALMLELTPLVEPLSLDEAFLDLAGTERLHRAPPASLLARLQAAIERELGVTASVGLSPQQVPRQDRLRPRQAPRLRSRSAAPRPTPSSPASRSRSSGASAAPPSRALEREGIRTIADLRARDRKALIRRFGSLGDRLWRLAHGQDARAGHPRPRR